MKYRPELTWPQIRALREAAAAVIRTDDPYIDLAVLRRADVALMAVKYRPTRAQRDAATGASRRP